MIGHVLWQIWNWPNGIVVGNLMASGICSVLVYAKLKMHLNKQHRERLEQAERHHQKQMDAICGE